MYEAYQRTQTAQAFGFKNGVEWNSAVPDEKELDITGTLTPDTRLWFRPQSDLVYQHRSTVLVEAAVTMDSEIGDIRLQPRQKKIQEARRKMGNSGVLRKLELSTVGFFDFLFSNRWEEGCLLRVLPGKLLSNLFHGLVQLEKYHEVITYVTMVHTRKPSIHPCIKEREEQKRANGTARAVKVLVELEYFCPQARSVAFKMESRSRGTSLRSEDIASEAPSQFTYSKLEPCTSLGTGMMITTLISRKKSPEQTVGQDLSTRTSAKTEQESVCTKQSASVKSASTKTAGTVVVQEPDSPSLSAAAAEDNQSGLYQPTFTLTTDNTRGSLLPSIEITTFPRPDYGRMAQKKIQLASSFFVGTLSGTQLSADTHAKGTKSPEPAVLAPIASFLNISNKEVHLADASTESLAGSMCHGSRRNIEDGGDDNVAFQQHVYHEAVFSPSGDESGIHTTARCNIRGQSQPSNHKHCGDPYHMVRQPFYYRRHRYQTAFPPIQVSMPPRPSPPPRSRAPPVRSDRDAEDDLHRRPRPHPENSTDVVAPDPILKKSPLSKDLGKYPSVKKQLEIVADERKDCSLKQKPGLKKKQSNKDSDEDGDTILWEVDTERVKIFRKDINRMDSEFFIDKPVRQKNVSTKKRLNKTFRTHQESEQIPTWTPGYTKINFPAHFCTQISEDPKETKGKRRSEKGARKKKLSDNFDSAEEAKKSKKNRNQRNVASPTHRGIISSYKVPKQWEKCPDFMQFYHYLNGDPRKIHSPAPEPKQSVTLQQKGDSTTARFSARTSDNISRSGQQMLEDGLDNCLGELTSQKIPEKQRKNSRLSYQKMDIKKESRLKRAIDSENQSNIQIFEAFNTKKLPPVPNVRTEAPDAFLSYTKEQLVSSSQEQKQQSYTALSNDTFEAFYLSKEQDSECREAGLLISDIDPWHMYVPDTFLRRDSHDMANLENDLLRRRKMLQKLIERGKVILQMNKSRVWSLVREVPRDPRIKMENKTKAIPDQLPTISRENENKAAPDPLPTISGAVRFDLQSEQPDEPDPASVSSAKRFACEIRKRNPGKMQPMVTKAKEVPTEPRGDLSKKAQNLTPGFLPPLIDDDQISEKISEEQLFDLMNFSKMFDICNLKHSYSFEKMFAHRMNTIPKYRKRLAKYRLQPHITQKIGGKKANVKKGKKAKSVVSPSYVADKLKSLAMQCTESPVGEGGLDDVAEDVDNFTNECFHHLLLALKLFVVRKERATSVNPVQSRVSITFSRRPVGMLETEVTSIIEDPSCSRNTVKALCQTLFMQ